MRMTLIRCKVGNCCQRESTANANNQLPMMFVRKGREGRNTMMNERNSIMTKKLSSVVVLLSIVVLLTNGCVYDLLNASIKLDGKECKTPTGEWGRNQKYVECVSKTVL